MYRNVWYDNKKGEVHLWTWNSSGKRIKEIVPFEPYLYIESQIHHDATSIYNTHLRKLTFKKQFDRFRFVQDSAIKRIFYNLPVEQQFLIDNYRLQNESIEFTKNPLKICFLDIEVFSPGDFPEPKFARDPINAITIYDSLSKTFTTWGLNGNFKTNLPNSTYIKCVTEKELLLKFIKYWKSDYPDIVSGWNSETFDIPYLISRITNLFDEEKAKELSPVHSLWYKEGIIRRFGKVEGKWIIKGISSIDYMEIYRIFAKLPQESYSLGNIAEVELGIGKLKIAATNLSALAKSNWQQFIEYNIHDVFLLTKLEEKLQFLVLMRQLAYVGLVNFEQALGTIAIVTGAMAIEALKRGQVISTFNHKAAGDYEGGYVKDPVRGLQEAVVSFDVNSLYPNTIVTLNLSPETKLGKVNSRENGEISVSFINGQVKTVAQDKFNKFLKEKKISISKSDVLFSQKIKGICPALIDGIYKQRVEVRSQLKDTKKKMSKIKDKKSDEYVKLKFLSEQLDIKQYTLKIFLNRIYGTYANKHSPFYDLDLAASITLTGQECIRTAGQMANQFMQKYYTNNKQSPVSSTNVNYDCVLYSDTDSLYLTINEYLKRNGISLTEYRNEASNDRKISEFVHKIINSLEDYLNSEIEKWAINELYSIDSRLQFKREAICDVGIFLEKKRYILHILDEEGIPCSKTKYVGVEVASTNVPSKVKPLIKNIVEIMIKTKSSKETNKAFQEAYENFKQLKVEEIAFPKGVNSFDKYNRQAKDLSTVKGTPCAVKAAISYNYFLNKYNVGNKYEKIRGGNKIKYFYTVKNPWNVDTIAFIDVYPPEFQLRPDVDKMFEKLVVAPVERLYNVVNWKVIPPNRAIQTDLFELLG